MATTIQIPIDLKQELDILKKNSKKSYADIIRELLKKEEKQKDMLLLEEYAQKYNTENLKEVKEWENSENGWE